jgi:hypothetical protein
VATALVAFLDELRDWTADLFAKFADMSPWPDPPYPPVSLVGLRTEELNAAAESLSTDEIVTALQGYFLGSPRDIGVRWVVFGALYALAQEYAEIDEDEEGEPPWSPASDRYLGELTSLYTATVEPGALTDPKAIGWEIMNGSLLGQWSVVDDLFKRLDVVMPEGEGETPCLAGAACVSSLLALVRSSRSPRTKSV